MLYLNVMSKIPDHVDEGLFMHYGFRGFPTLAFLDADGTLLQEYAGPRTVAGFEAAGTKIQAYFADKKKAASGDKGAAVDLLLENADMGKLTYDEFEKKLGAMSGLTKDQQDHAQKVGMKLEYKKLNQTVKGEAFLALAKKGFSPDPSDMQGAVTFWLEIMNYADYYENAGVYEQGLNGLKDVLAGNPRAAPFLKSKEAHLKEMRDKATKKDESK